MTSCRIKRYSQLVNHVDKIVSTPGRLLVVETVRYPFDGVQILDLTAMLPVATNCLPISDAAEMSDNLKQLLLKKSDWFAGEILEQIGRSRYPQITPAQSRLLAHMGGKPIGMSELARRLAISRQAVHRTIAELCRQDILQVMEDPARGNAKLVVYTEKGRAVNRAGAAIIDATEQKIADRIGADKLALLKELLNKSWD